MKPHPHAEIIKAWADGEQIQVKDGAAWYDVEETNEIFHRRLEYRVKPAEPAKIYPCTQMSGNQLHAAYFVGRPGVDVIWSERGLRQVSDKALRHACDNGQIVTREEFDRAVGDRKARDMEVAKAVQEKASKCMSRERHVHRIQEIMEINLPRVISEIGKE